MKTVFMQSKTFKALGILAGILTSPLSANAMLPVAPFTAPNKLSIPSNVPVIPSGVWEKADWMDTAKSKTSSWRSDHYIYRPRRRGNIVSFYMITRSQRKETTKLNRNTKGYGSGLFLPGYGVSLMRYDCMNDRYSSEIHLVNITDAHGDGAEGGFVYYTDRQETKSKYIPDQTKVFIEGRPYWVIDSKKQQYWANRFNSRSSDLDGGADDWHQIRPGSYGAGQLDYACRSL